MGWFYFASINCQNEITASALAEKYAGQTFVFSKPLQAVGGGDTCRFLTHHYEEDHNWWTDIVPSGITANGISSSEEAKKANEFCNVFYGMLRNEPNFNFAMLGVECSANMSLNELKEILTTKDEFHNHDGLVVSNGILEMYRLENWQFFSETHRWNPKRRHVYSE